MEWIYKYFSLTAVIAGVGFLIRYLIQRKINNYFDKKLADHQKELAVMTERSKYDLSRKLFDFEAYATKKHTVYPELYKLMFELWIHLVTLSNEIKNLNKTYNFSELDEDGKSKGLISTYKLLLKYHEAVEYYKIQELFLSKEVSRSCSETLELTRELCGEFPKSNFNYAFLEGKTEKIGLNMTLLREVIYEELSYSHFEKTEEKVK